jgi:hypothetical protein
VNSGNYGWDLGRWDPPLVAEPQVEAFRGVAEGRIMLACTRGRPIRVIIETWRPLVPAGPARPATLTYRIDGVERSAPGLLGPNRFAFAGDATPALLAELARGSDLEALVPVHGGGVYPVTFDISDLAAAQQWVGRECADL